MDTGAIDCLIPRQRLEAIGLSPKGHRTYTLADGSEVNMDVTVGEIEFMDEIVGGTIVYGEANAEPLLGVTCHGIGPAWRWTRSTKPSTSSPTSDSEDSDSEALPDHPLIRKDKFCAKRFAWLTMAIRSR